MSASRVVSLILPVVLGLSSTPGLTFNLTMRTEGTNARGQPINTTMTAHEQVAGDQARIDWMATPGAASTPANPYQNMFMGPGIYWILSRGASTLTVVNTAKKQYFEMDLGGMMQGSSSLMNQSITDIDISTQRLPGDSVVDGYHTQHCRITDNHTINVSVMGMSITSKVQAVTDAYVAAELKNAINPFAQSSQQMLQSTKSEYLQKMGAAIGGLYQGMPVLEIIRTTTTDNKNRQSVSTMTRTVTDVSTSDIPASVFAIPPDYQKTQNMLAARNGAPGSDSASSASDSATSPASQAKKALSKLHFP
jgi:Domain of unknown function (DUF4412)